MFTLTDDVVPGYNSPTVITELYTSLHNSAVHYR